MKKLLAVVIASVMAISSPMTVFAEETITVSDKMTEAEVFSEEQSAESLAEGISNDKQLNMSAESDVVSALEGKDALKSHYRVGYELSAAQMAEKKELSKILVGFGTAIPGEDYVENQIVVEAESEEKAEEIAKGFGGSLLHWQEGVAVVETEMSTLAAVAMAADESFRLPAAYPNFWYTTDDVEYAFSDSKADFGADKFSNEITESDESEEVEENVIPEKEITDILAETDAMSEDATGAAETDVDDPYVVLQWFHKVIDTFNAWKVTKGAGVTVAVIDSGIDYSHVEFSGRVRAAYCITTGLLQNGAYDNVGHGTHVAGIIGAAADNGYGVVGVAPEVQILSLKALEKLPNSGQATGTTADIVVCINYAARQNVDVINMSLGGAAGGADDILFQNAIGDAVGKGITVVAAAGNESMDISKKDNRTVPACLDGVITVSSLDRFGDLSWFSNYGKIDVAAPGGTLLSNGDERDILSTVPGGYDFKSGTSMACPVVSGVAALIIASESANGAQAVKNVLQKSCINIGNSKNFGAGRVNAAAAVNAVSIYAKNDDFNVVSGKTLKLMAKTGTTSVKPEWILSDSSAGTLSQSGVFKAAKNIVVPVRTQITAVYGDRRDTVTVTIYPQGGKIQNGSKKSMALSYGQKARFSVMTDSGLPCTFKSSNNKVAIVDEKGNITAQSNGKATITATIVGGKKTSVKVTVKDTPFVIDRVVAVNATDRDAADMFANSFLAQNATVYPVTAGKTIKFQVKSSWPYNTSSNKKVQWTCTNGGKIKQNGSFKMDRHIASRTLVRITATPTKGAGGSESVYVAGFVPIEGFYFLNDGQMSSSTYVEVPAGYMLYVPYGMRYKEGTNTRAINPYPYVESSDSDISYGYYDDGSATNYRIAVVGKSPGTCRLTMISMDGAYRKATIDVVVY